MAHRRHRYRATVAWSDPAGTKRSSTHSRNHVIRVDGKPEIAASSDPAFRGDPARHNPEDLLVASLSSCHMLWYLGLAARAGLAVVDYVDEAEGTMVDEGEAGGRFERVVLRPTVTIRAGGSVETATLLHHDAHHACFIANSMNFPVEVEPQIVVAPAP